MARTLLLSYALNLFTKDQQGANQNSSVSINPIILTNQSLLNAKDFTYTLQLSPNESKTLDLLDIDIVLLRVLLIQAEAAVTISLDGEVGIPTSVYFKDFGVRTLPSVSPTSLPLIVHNTSSVLVNVKVVGVGF